MEGHRCRCARRVTDGCVRRRLTAVGGVAGSVAADSYEVNRMAYSRRFNSAVTALVVGVALGTLTPHLRAQARGGTPQTDQVTPVNTGANPYRVIRDWARFNTEQ